MIDTDISEAEMRRAFGLDQIPQKQPKPKSNPFSIYTLVELSVRNNGGPPFRFEHRSRSMSTLTAQLEAEKAARAKGYEVWVVLEIRQVST
ncbi:hypothetical protein LU640_20635 [Pseudomonas monteilii]|uniref:hypothetical protein n=1 Tax=Pseudomonas monteilii TaxID=76759 RepID=UPI001E4A4212|nr:hypothetical protein [Pseudomonas monteilii]MCE1021049.1 hypothetical protein [Pseudomonas monteilii]MCE1089053.1 hypothetical protein [Pseudomonas monteilii]